MSEGDAGLMRRARRDGAAFRLLYERHVGTVYLYLRRHVDREDALDLTAETFATALNALDRPQRLPDTDESVAPWLVGVARNLLREHWRRGRVDDRARRRLGLQDIAATDDEFDDVDRAIDDVRVGAGLVAAVAALPRLQRSAVTLRILEDRPYEEIALSLGIAPSTVRVCVHRALNRLRAGLAGAGEAT